ncbi:MAG: agmatinase [Ignavibacteria bacterium GWB2_35_12]|nr:MAG: agmatinase [Ignavibacteria bacterium GWA2_35_8]OGU39638.1 MAG: agmatinase [Ignavibacteria bacterium GWB2_35_12]OGU91884.1 MAG: agmatinase [Ignavibacteria bacterium RIFOXYA2_FULL_35_10]OGV24040.1 MAG: agmatinase [Ignavibacteria bacterium RIFOXYC2_FULL_35_21]
MNKNYLAIEEKYSNLNDSAIAVVSAPYEHSTSYGKGASLGPKAILKASAFVEFYDDEFERELCFDLGIATIKHIKFKKKYDKEALELIKQQVDEFIRMGKFVVTLGGEHTISIAPIEAHYKYYPNMSILHFDAHSDLRDSYEDSKYSHACFMARVIEFFPPEKVIQVGIRAQCIEEAQLIKEKGIKTFYASAIRRNLHGENWQKKVVDTLSDEIYITFDIDYFDPSIMPSTGTPEPDGFFYNETLEVFREINKQKKKIIGFDVVELAPIETLHHANLTTARLVYKLLNYAFNR